MGVERATDAADAVGDPGRGEEWVVGIAIVATAQEGAGAKRLDPDGRVDDSCVHDSSGGCTLEAASWDGRVREVSTWEVVAGVGAA